METPLQYDRNVDNATGVSADLRICEKLIDIKRPPVPRILVGEFDKASHDPAAALDGVDLQATREHLGAPAIDHRVEHRLVGAEQRNVIAAQKLRYETGQFLNHGRPLISSL